MAKLDYVRFLPITQSEAIAKKVNYRQEKNLESKLRSIEKAEKYSKSFLEKSNHTWKQNMMTSRARTSTQSCLKLTNSEVNGESYVALNRSATKTKVLDCSKSRTIVPRLSSPLVTDVRQPGEQKNSHLKLTRSASDSVALNQKTSGNHTKLKKSSSLESEDNSSVISRRKSVSQLSFSRKIAWAESGTENNSINNGNKSKIEGTLPKLGSDRRHSLHQQQQHQQQRRLQQEKDSKKKMQLCRSRSLPNTVNYSAPSSSTKAFTLTSPSPKRNQTFLATSPSWNSKLESLIEINNNDEEKINIIAGSNEDINITKCLNDIKIKTDDNINASPCSSSIPINMPRAPLRRPKCRPAWGEIIEKTDFGNSHQRLRKTKSIE